MKKKTKQIIAKTSCEEFFFSIFTLFNVDNAYISEFYRECQLTSYKRQLTSYKRQLTRYKRQLTSYKRQFTNYERQFTSYKRQLTSYSVSWPFISVNWPIISEMVMLCFCKHDSCPVFWMNIVRRITKKKTKNPHT